MNAHDIDLMQHADGELELDDRLRDPDSRGKVEAIGELGELLRGHLELATDAVPAKRFGALWREIDKAIEAEATPGAVAAAAVEPASAPAERAGVWRRVTRWFEHYRGHVITGMVSAGAVAALALVLRGPGERASPGQASPPIEATPAAYRPTEIESLDTPGGTGTVFHLKDDDDSGSTTVIWVTPEDTVEGI